MRGHQTATASRASPTRRGPAQLGALRRAPLQTGSGAFGGHGLQALAARSRTVTQLERLQAAADRAVVQRVDGAEDEAPADGKRGAERSVAVRPSEGGGQPRSPLEKEYLDLFLPKSEQDRVTLRRRLALRLHPDKTGGLTPQEISLRLEAFKAAETAFRWLRSAEQVPREVLTIEVGRQSGIAPQHHAEIARHGFGGLGVEVLEGAARLAGADMALFGALCRLGPAPSELALDNRPAAVLRAVVRDFGRPVTSGLLAALRALGNSAPLRALAHEACRLQVADNTLRPQVLQAVLALHPAHRVAALRACDTGLSPESARCAGDCAQEHLWLFEALTGPCREALEKGLDGNAARLVRLICLPGRRPPTPLLLARIREVAGVGPRALLLVEACGAGCEDAQLTPDRLQPLMDMARALAEDDALRARAISVLAKPGRNPAALAPFAFRQDQFDKAAALGDAAHAARKAEGETEIEKRREKALDAVQDVVIEKHLTKKQRKIIRQTWESDDKTKVKAILAEQMKKHAHKYMGDDDLGAAKHAKAAKARAEEAFETARAFFAGTDIANDADAAAILAHAGDDMGLARRLIRACRESDVLRVHVMSHALPARALGHLLGAIEPGLLVGMFAPLGPPCLRAFATPELAGCLRVLVHDSNVDPARVRDLADALNVFKLAEAPERAADLGRILGGLSVPDTWTLMRACPHAFGTGMARLEPLAEIFDRAPVEVMRAFLEYAQAHFFSRDELLIGLKAAPRNSTLNQLKLAVLGEASGGVLGRVKPNGKKDVAQSDFTAWLKVVSLHLADGLMTLQCQSGWKRLPGTPDSTPTDERSCEIHTSGSPPVPVGRFVVHKHPGVKKNTEYGSHMHAKPRQGGDTRVKTDVSGTEGFWKQFPKT